MLTLVESEQSSAVDQGLSWRTRSVSGDVGSMRSLQQAVDDPFGLDDLEDGTWREPQPLSLLIVRNDAADVRVEWRDGGLYMNGVLLVDMTPLIELFADFGMRLSALVQSPAWEQMMSVVRELQAIDEGPAEHAQRRRHGHAAYCPTHGVPTRGGLCRRCARR